MGYKWKPNKAQKEAFKKMMDNPIEKAAYEARKTDRANKRRAKSEFDYNSAGGSFIPTQIQYDFAMQVDKTDSKIRKSANSVIIGYTCKTKVPHDDIHVINDLIRKQ